MSAPGPSRLPPGLFVTGTGTGVGKSVVSGCIVAAGRAAGRDVIGLKPVLTGLDDAPDPLWPPDDVLLARAAGRPREAVSGFTYGPPVSPHLAAELAGERLELNELVKWITARAGRHRSVVVEGVGGLLVPLAPDLVVADLAVALGLPLLIAALPTLGTINHTMLTLEAARRRGLEVAGVVMGPWPAIPSAIEVSNRLTVERLGQVPVWTLPPIPSADPDQLSAAARELPVGTWLGPADPSRR